MADDNIVDFTGTTLKDIDPDMVLEAAKGGLERVLIVGLTKPREGEGEVGYYFATSGGDNAQAVWDLEQFKAYLLGYGG